MKLEAALKDNQDLVLLFYFKCYVYKVNVWAVVSNHN